MPCPRCLCGLNPPVDSLTEQDDAAFYHPKPDFDTARGSRNSARSDGADSGVGHESPNSRYFISYSLIALLNVHHFFFFFGDQL